MAYKVLLIDDEIDLVKAVSTRLMSKGYEVIPAFDGNEGVRKAVRELPDVIILDIMMPGKDGYTVIRELKRAPATKNIPVIVLTAKQEMKDLFEPEGVEYYMTKPFDNAELIGNIEKVVIKGKKGGA
ncbi:MAG: response regulator [Candidatus Omnitrophica bacterium]|nr:response regulator [Candidatus Omnitrophota bacterium]